MADETPQPSPHGPMDSHAQPGYCRAGTHVAFVYRFGDVARPEFICAEHLRRAMRIAVWPYGFRYLKPPDG